MYNPRFPFTLVVKRGSVNTYGEIVTDSEGNPTYEVVPLSRVEMLDYEPVINGDGGFNLTTVQSIECGIRTATSNTRSYGDVIVSDYRIAVPMIVTPINVGDVLEITTYERTIRLKCVKCQTYNIGTTIWANEAKD